jgi:localization factor PodJL
MSQARSGRHARDCDSAMEINLKQFSDVLRTSAIQTDHTMSEPTLGSADAAEDFTRTNRESGGRTADRRPAAAGDWLHRVAAELRAPSGPNIASIGRGRGQNASAIATLVNTSRHARIGGAEPSGGEAPAPLAGAVAAREIRRDPEGETYAQLSQRLDELEARLRQGANGDGDKFLRTALTELEARLQASAGRGAPIPRKTIPAFSAALETPPPRQASADPGAATREAESANPEIANVAIASQRSARAVDFNLPSWGSRILGDVTPGGETKRTAELWSEALDGRSADFAPAAAPKTETLANPQLNPTAFTRMQQQTAQIRDLLADVLARPKAIAKIEAQLDALTRKAEEAITKTAEPPHYDALSQHIETSHRQLTAQFEAGLAAGAAETSGIKNLVQTLAEKIESARAPKASDPAIEALQREMAKIAQRLGDAETGLGSLTRIEQSIASLFEQLEDTRQTAYEAAAAIRKAERSPEVGSDRHDLADPVPAATQEIADLRAERDEAGRRVHEVLSAVQETVGKVANRLAKIENDLGEMRPHHLGPLSASSLPPIFGPLVERRQNGPVEDDVSHAETLNRSADVRIPFRDRDSFGAQSAYRGLIDRAAPQQPEYGAENAANAANAVDFLIEPGSGFPRRREQGRDHPFAEAPAQAREREGGVGRADFIAAARRAAQATRIEASQSLLPTADAEGVARRRGFFPTRTVILSVASLFLALGAYALSEWALHEGFGATAFLKLIGENAWRNVAPPAEHADTPSLTSSAATTQQTAPNFGTSTAVPKSSPTNPIQSLVNSGLLDPSPVSPAGAATASAGSLPRQTLAIRAIAGSDPIVVGAISQGVVREADADLDPELAALPVAAMTFEDLRGRAEAGNAAAQFELGARFADGRAGTRDLMLAARYYVQAAQQGLAKAQYRLALLAGKGMGVDRDLVRAQNLYLAAAGQGNARAIHNLGVLAAAGAEGPPDYATAAIWSRKAAAFDIRDSQFNLAILLASGLGLPQDYAQSYAWFSIAAAKGDAEADAKRDEVALKLSAKDLAAAKATAESFRPRALDPAVNESTQLQPDDATPAISPTIESPPKPKISRL